ncbi:hypothetical protein ACFO5T_05420 [Dokdonia genika]|jgi:hypothetical protein|uniref:VPDSG-CTERM protein sorting domain-containing protein n=1 Tax=Dokdonia genika TaxID=308113 RepID=A0ABV9L7H5_9FLAO|nr:hypothetical protein [Dokdonia sp. MED134]AOE05964.1 hypothetical protein [uncultured bacterium]
MKNSIFKKYMLSTLFIVCISTSASAQITFANDVNDQAPVAPIDGFVTVGIVAGAFLGLRKRFKD